MEPSSTPTPSKKLTLVGIALIGLLILLIGAVFFYQQEQVTVKNNIRNTESTNGVDPETIARAPSRTQKVSIPPLSVASYNFGTKMPSVPTTLSSYSLKSNYTQEEMAQMARTLGGLVEDKSSSDERYKTFYNLTNPKSHGYLVFDQVTGGFVFQSYGVFQSPLSIPGQAPTVAATLIARQLGYDETVTCTDTYQRPEYPDYVYVECHRDWALAGLPILGVPGVLSIDPNTAVNSLKPTAQEADFNTLTVVLSSSTNRVVELRSNLRKIKEKVSVTASTDIISPENIKQSFNTNKSTLSISLPAGSTTEQGLIPWNKIYQGSSAQATSATVTDFTLAYLENPAGILQESLTPYYIVRGTAELNTGYTVNFVQAIPALNTQVAGVTFPTINQKTQKQGTIIEPTTAPTINTPTMPVPTPITEPVAGCVMPAGATELNFSIPGLGDLQFYYNNSYYDAREIYFKSQSIPFETIKKTRELLYVGSGETLGPIAQQYLIFAARELTTPRYLQPPATPPTSIAEAKRFFKRLNENTGPGPYGRANGISTNKCINAIRYSLKAPPALDGITDCSTDGWYDLPLLRALTEKTATALVTAVQNNSLTTLAAQPDLFPESIITDFEQLLYTTTDTTTGVGEAVKQQLACRVTGSSPKIYVYSNTPQSISLKINAPLTYYYPEFSSKNEWTLSTHLRGVSVYYEYNPEKISFTEPSKGFIIEKNKLEDFIKNKIAKQLSLTAEEQETLLQEARNTLIDSSQNYSHLQLSFADRTEIDSQLPLDISPKPTTVERLHLLIKPLAKHKNISQPTLPSLERSEYTVIELGARLIK